MRPLGAGARLNAVNTATFWRRFAAIDNVIAIKIAPFSRYRTLDVIRGVVEAGAEERPVDLHDMVVRRSRREYRVPISFSPLDQRDGFEETVLSYTPEEAMQEAGRCLDCHEICSLCVGVCPNMALMTYQMDSVRADLPALTVRDGAVVAGDASPFMAPPPT